MNHTTKAGDTVTKEIRIAAAKHELDLRTLVKALNGGRVRGLAGERVQRALAELQPEPR